jgi:putative ABC transport system permease protein
MWRMKMKALRNRQLEQDLDDELQSHIEMKAEELQANGVPRDEAFHQARRIFGNLTATRETTRSLHMFTALEDAFADLRYGIRRLRREPAFSLTAIVTLGLVIGVNGAIFSAVEAVLLRPLPFPAAERLVGLFGTDRTTRRDAFPAADLERLKQARSLDGVAAYQTQSVNLTGIEQPGRLIGGFISSSFLPLLGGSAAKGRTFGPENDKPGSERVCVLNYEVWRDRFGSDPGMPGRTITLNNEVFTVVGIMPESFRAMIINAEVWIPLPFLPNYSLDPGRKNVEAVVRLAPGVSVETANAELGTLSAQMAAEGPATQQDWGFALVPIRQLLVGQTRPILLALAAATGCVLLIGCANIAGLLLAKAAGRRPEMAIRVSLGAGSGRLARQLITESLLLSLLGGAVGVAIAYGGARVLDVYCQDLIRPAELRVNGAVLAYLAGVSVVTGILFGLAPVAAIRRQCADSLRQRGVASGSGGFREWLVAAQVGMALILLIGAGLLIKSLNKVASIDPGFRGEHVLSMEYRVPRSKYAGGEAQTRFHYEVVRRVRALPGVDTAALVGALPFSGNNNRRDVRLPERPEVKDAPLFNPTSPGYFRTVGIPLLAGRDFAFTDQPNTPLVVIVSQSFAAKYWPGQKAVGRQIQLPAGKNVVVAATVVGMVGDAMQDALDDTDLAEFYSPYAQDPSIFATLTVLAKGDAGAMTRSVQRAIWSVDKDQPMWKIRTLQSLVDRSFTNRRYMAWVTGCISLLALGLAAVGLSGLLGYIVTQRTAEFGVRLALGAAPRNILGLVFRQGLKLTVAGLAVGIVASLLLTPLIRAQIYQVNTTDISVYVGLSLLMLVVAGVALWLPARRAMRVDPVTAIRNE